MSKTPVTILGATGSIGQSTLDVISRHLDLYAISALSANDNVEKMMQLCQQYKPEVVAMAHPHSAAKLRMNLRQANMPIEVLEGADGVSRLSAEHGEVVVCGIVGAAGLMSTVAAVESGKKVLVANKEPLVMLGDFILDLAKKNGACLLPIDSEHNAIFQCMPQYDVVNQNGNSTVFHEYGIRKILLTGSGGPFRTLPLESLGEVTPDQACRHPNWDMGRKISVDSATMMNKGLELIEACCLFGVDPDMVEIVVHPQSIIHSMVEYVDGSVLAQMANPDMKVPIANALAWPKRIESGAQSLDFSSLSQFNFESPDLDRFPALGLAKRAAIHRGTLPAIMNAANEVAVNAFLEGSIRFIDITKMVEWVMDSSEVCQATDLDSVLHADQNARALSMEFLQKRPI